MNRICLLLPACLCFIFSYGQSITKSAVICTQIGTNNWSSPSGMTVALQVNDGQYLRADLASNQTSNTLNLTGFGFAIPSSSILNGVVVSIKRKGGSTGEVSDKIVRLIIGGAATGENKFFSTAWKSTDEIIKYGASNDKWSLLSLTASQISSPSFGVSIQIQNGAMPDAAYIDHVSITVSYTLSAQTPVRFVSFKSKKENAGNHLTWKVHEEDRLLRYEIERSVNATSFEKIAQVPAKAQEEYSYIDQQPLAGKSFYRIKGIHMDGKYGFSTVLSINAGTSGVVFKAFPTVVQNQLTVQHDPATIDTRIIINSHDGKILKNLTPLKGSMETIIDLSTLGHGLYVLKFKNSNGAIETLKFLKQ